MGQKGERIRLHTWLTTLGLEEATIRAKQLISQYRKEVLTNKNLEPSVRESLIRSYLEHKKFLRTQDIGDDIYERKASETYTQYCKVNGIEPKYQQSGDEGAEEIVQDVDETGDNAIPERMETESPTE